MFCFVCLERGLQDILLNNRLGIRVKDGKHFIA